MTKIKTPARDADWWRSSAEVRVKIESWTLVGAWGAKHWYWKLFVDSEIVFRGGGQYDPDGPECHTEADARRSCIEFLRKHFPNQQAILNCESSDRLPSEMWLRNYEVARRKRAAT